MDRIKKIIKDAYRSDKMIKEISKQNDFIEQVTKPDKFIEEISKQDDFIKHITKSNEFLKKYQNKNKIKVGINMTNQKTRRKPNENINEIHGIIDLVVDEYGNYYTPYHTTVSNGKLTKVVLCHMLYHSAFASVFCNDELKKTYRFSHLGEPIVERLNNHILSLENENRKIFSISDLLSNGTEVGFYDIRQFKTKNKGK